MSARRVISVLTQNQNPIDLIRFMAIFSMFFAHYRIGQLAEFGAFTSVSGFIYQTLHFGVSRTSSAFLGITSGYFVYLQIMRYGYQATLKKRLRTLIWPAMYWSGLFVVVTSLAFMVMTGQLPASLDVGPWQLLNKILPIQYWPANIPLHYLVDLFKLCLVAPALIYLIDQLPKAGKVALVITLALIPNSVADPGNSDSFLPRWDLIVYFVAGMCIASENVDLSKAITQPIQSVFILTALACILVMAPVWESAMSSDSFRIQYVGYLMIMVVKFAGIFLFVGLAQRLINSPIIAKFVPQRETVFTAFCLHGIVVYFLARIASNVSEVFSEPHLLPFLAFLSFPFISFGLAMALRQTVCVLQSQRFSK
jgi:hypothetical protein